jgi:hypothetical protein
MATTPRSARTPNVVCYGGWRASTRLWQPGPGVWMLTVACTATYELAPGRSPMLSKPPKLEAPGADDDRARVEPWAPPAPRKRHPEVVVVGHAHAEPGSTATSLVARLGVGELEKLVHVHGDAHLDARGVATAPVPFARMPLRWERAAAADAEGAVGVRMGAAATVDADGRVPLPNLRPMGAPIEGRDDVVVPVGFGPLRPTSAERARCLRQHAAGWDHEGWAERPLPADLDYAYFDVAPPDQRLAALAGNEAIVLEHLHPRLPRLRTHLAPAMPCVVVSLGGEEGRVAVACDTLVVDADAGLAFVVWRALVPLADPARDVVVFVSAAPVESSSTGTRVDGGVASVTALPEPGAGSAVETIAITSAGSAPVLPFGGEARPPAEDRAAVTLTDVEALVADEDDGPPTVRRGGRAAREG